jgi:hypothetical protein
MISTGQLIKYLLEGLAITVAIYLITKKSLGYAELFTIALTISVTFMILDLFAPSVASGARQGAGFGLGFQQFGAGQDAQGLESPESNQDGGANLPAEYYGGNPQTQCSSMSGGSADPQGVSQSVIGTPDSAQELPGITGAEYSVV